VLAEKLRKLGFSGEEISRILSHCVCFNAYRQDVDDAIEIVDEFEPFKLRGTACLGDEDEDDYGRVRCYEYVITGSFNKEIDDCNDSDNPWKVCGRFCERYGDVNGCGVVCTNAEPVVIERYPCDDEERYTRVYEVRLRPGQWLIDNYCECNADDYYSADSCVIYVNPPRKL